MPAITQIKPQRKKDRFNIFLDGLFGFGIDAENLLKNNLKVGKRLTQEQIKKIITEDTFKKLIDRAVNFLSFRPRTEKEIKDYLTKKLSQLENIKFKEAQNSPVTDAIILKLKKLKLIDDVEFAKIYIEEKVKFKKKGIRLIKYELLRKGISKDILQEVLKVEEDETQTAYSAIEKKLDSWKKLDNLKLKRKVFEHLARRGFEYETIEKVFAKIKKKS